MNGLLNINKPRGLTSHDVVLCVRRKTKVKKVGHAGTLDPQATGVLLLLVGQATKIAQFISSWPKEYHARLRLGITTTTQDIWGEVLEEVEAGHILFEEVKEAVLCFSGEILQVPPMVSATWCKGKRLYQLARRGEEVERVPRRVEIYEWKLLDFDPGKNPELSFKVKCSAGTYIRTLCHDLGQALGVGGCLVSLVRTKIGSYHLASSISLEEFESRDCGEVILPIDQVLHHLPLVRVSGYGAEHINHGRPLESSWIEETEGRIEEGSTIRIYDPSVKLLALARTTQSLCRPGIVARLLRVLN